MGLKVRSDTAAFLPNKASRIRLAFLYLAWVAGRAAGSRQYKKAPRASEQVRHLTMEPQQFRN